MSAGVTPSIVSVLMAGKGERRKVLKWRWQAFRRKMRGLQDAELTE